MGIAKETVFGTPVTATVFCPVGDIKIDPDPGLFFPELMMGTLEKNVFPLYGEYKFNGNAGFPLFPTNGIELLVGAIGADVVTGTTPLYTHTISPANALPSFTIEKNVGGYQSEQYAGCKINKYELKLASGNQPVEVTVDFMGKTVATMTTPTAVTAEHSSNPVVTSTNPSWRRMLIVNAATMPRAVSSTQVKSLVCEPSPKMTGGRPARSLVANFGITSALVPVACERGP